MTDAPSDTSWHRVADADELTDGMLKRVAVAGRVLVLIRVGDRFGALDNRCPHMGGPLAEGSLENGVLVCPWHGREYDPLSGQCDGYADSVRAYAVEMRPRWGLRGDMLMMSPDAVLWLDVADRDAAHDGSSLYFFKNRQFACWDVLADRMREGYPREIAARWPGVLEAFPDRRLRGALRVPEWGNRVYFLFEGETQAVVWNMDDQRVEGPAIDARKLLPTRLSEADVTLVYARLADGTSVIYGFHALDYTRWTVGPKFPEAEDAGFPRKIAADWKDGLVLAPRAGVYVDWPNRSSAHSNRKLYFFMGDLYLRWDVPSNTRNYRLDIIAGWKGWPSFA